MKGWDEKKTLAYLYKALLALAVIVGFVLLYYLALPAAGAVLKFAVLALMPFLLAWFCAIISKGATDFFTIKLHMPRSLAVIVLMLLAFGSLGTVIALIGARVWVEITSIAGNMSHYYQTVLDWFSGLGEKLSLIDFNAAEFGKLTEWVDKLFATVGDWFSSLASGTISLISSTPTAFIFVIAFFVALFFCCRDHDKFVAKLTGFLPEKNRDKASAIYARFAEVVRGFCVAQLTLIGVSMVLCIVFFFILGVDGALTLGLFCGFLDILPVVGPATIILPWAVISLMSDKIFMGVGLIVLLVVLTVVKNILQPKVVGDRIGLHPLLTLLGIFIGMRIFGLWGLALGPIILAMIVCIYRAVKEVNNQ